MTLYIRILIPTGSTKQIDHSATKAKASFYSFQFLPVRLSKSDHFLLPIVDCLFHFTTKESTGNQQSKIGNASVPSGATKQIDRRSSTRARSRIQPEWL